MQKNSDSNESTRSEIIYALINAKEREEPIVLSPKDKSLSLFSQITEVNNEHLFITNTIPPLMIPYLLDVPSFLVQFRSFWIRFDKLEGHGRNLKIPIKDFGLIELSRSSERVCFTEKDLARVKINHPFDTGTTLFRRIFDLSAGGMSFRSHVNSPFLQPNRILPSLEIYIENKLQERHQGKIVYVKQIIDLQGQDYFQVGVQFFD